MADYEDIKKSVASTGGGGVDIASLVLLFFDGKAERAIEIADENSVFHKLYKGVTGDTLSLEHATMAAALAVKADRAKLHNNVHWATHGWRSEALRTAMLETYTPNKPQLWKFDDDTLTDITTAYDVFISHDKQYLFYRISSTSTTMYRRTMSTPGDLSTLGAAVGENLSTAGFSTFNQAYGFNFNHDGTILAKVTSNRVEWAEMSTPYDLSTLGSVTSDAGIGGSGYGDVVFNHDSSRVYVNLSNNSSSSPSGKDGWVEGVMSTPGDMSTVTWDNDRVWFFAYTSGFSGCGFLDDGKIFYQFDGSKMYMFRLSTAGNLIDSDITTIPTPFESTNQSGKRWLHNSTNVSYFAAVPDGSMIALFGKQTVAWLDTTNFDWTQDSFTGAQGLGAVTIPEQTMDMGRDDPSTLFNAHSFYSVRFSDDGLRMYAHLFDNGGTSMAIWYNLAVPWDLDTAKTVGYDFTTTEVEQAIFSEDGLTVWGRVETSFSTFVATRWMEDPAAITVGKDFMQDGPNPFNMTIQQQSTAISWFESWNSDPSFWYSNDKSSVYMVYSDNGSTDLKLAKLNINGEPGVMRNSLGSGPLDYETFEFYSDFGDWDDSFHCWGLHVSNDEEDAYFHMSNSNNIYHLNMSTAGDLSTASLVKESMPIMSETYGARHITFSPNYRYAFLLTSDRLFRFSIPGTEYRDGGS